MSILEPVESFFLYGEPPRSADAGFLHVEPLAIRSSPANWTIRSHAHRELGQLFCLEQGSAVMQADGKTLRFSAPSLVAVLLRTIDAFTWIPDSAGHVLTIGTPTLRPLLARAPDVARLSSQVASVPLIDTVAMRRTSSLLVRLAAKNAWDAPAHGLATEALQMVMNRTIPVARRMLVTSNRSAAEIGYQLDFTDPAYFSRLFHAQVGENLRAFRKASEA